MLAIKTGTTSYRTIAGVEQLAAGEVAYSGGFVWDADGLTPLMVWDAGIGNVRAMTSAEIAALPATKQAAKDAAEPDMAALRNAAQAALDANATYLALATPTNAQVVAQVQRLTQQQQAIIKAVARIVGRSL